MKKFILSLTLFFLSICIVKADLPEKGNQKLYLQTGLYYHSLFQPRPSLGGYFGAGSYNWGIGAAYHYFLTNRLSLTSGISYRQYKGKTQEVIYYAIQPIAPTSDDTNYIGTNQVYTLNTLSTPLGLRYYFHKNIFVTAGLSLDIELAGSTRKNQKALGWYGGIGAEFNLNDQYSMAIQPVFNWHAMTDFNENYKQRQVMAIGLQLQLGRLF